MKDADEGSMYTTLKRVGLDGCKQQEKDWIRVRGGGVGEGGQGSKGQSTQGSVPAPGA